MSGRIKVKDEDIIGHRFHSRSCNDFTVIRKTSNKAHGEIGNYLYEVKFDVVNGVEYTKEVRKEDILKGKINNPYYPSLYNVGYIGNATSIGNKYEYNKWNNMISRCYNERDRKYKNYGLVGVYVCDRWKCFEYFLEDFKQIEGYKEGEKQSLDKDIKSVSEPKYYSLETCCLVSIEQNSKEMIARISPYFKAVSPNGEEFISNCQRDFVRNYGLDRSCINDTLRGKQTHHKGWKFEYINTEENCYDQN